MRTNVWTAGATCALLVTSGLSGCVDRDLAVLEPKVSRSIDQEVHSGGVANVDLLLVIDDSGSMEQEQALLGSQIRDVIEGLTAPPDEDGDGEPDWNPVESLQVAIVTSDMGTNGVPPSTDLGRCSFGDGLGRDGAPFTAASCDPSGALVQRWQTGDDASAFADRLGCLAQAVGIEGCGFEQPLLSAARALERGDAGFPRPDALLAVLVLTDEEDCSLGDPSAFFSTVPSGAAINVHCVNNPGLLAPTAELVERLRAGRTDDTFLFAALAGVPVDLADADYDTILADERMRYVPDPTTTVGLRYACTRYDGDGEARSLATPGRRIVELASQIEGGLVRSICEESFRPALAELTRRIGRRITGACLNRALTPASDGSVPCNVEETLPPGMACTDLPARTPIGIDEEGREQCDITQSPAGVTSGWYYDATDASCDRLAFTDDAVPPFGSSIRFQCLVEVERPDTGEVSP